MNSIIKWAGGKENELTYILNNLPNKNGKEIERYIEPFVRAEVLSTLTWRKKNHLSMINQKS